jgi:hypothetical protein
MDYSAEESWAHIESLRIRVHSLCKHIDKDELASVDSEFIELRERVWETLRASNMKA